MKPSRLWFGVLVVATSARLIWAEELQHATVKAWEICRKDSGKQMQERAEGLRPFLWIEESADHAARLRSGEVLVAPAVEHGTTPVAHGLIHHWIGAIFIPSASIEGLLAVVHDYDDYQRIYRPVVASSKTLAFAGSSQDFQMVWERKILFVHAAMQANYHAHDVALDAHRGYSIAETSDVQEIEDYGHAGEHLLPAGTGNGFIWRIRSVARYEERDGGVYLELEAFALTRDIPSSIAWMVRPMVNRLSINSLTTTLRQTRDAVTLSRQSPRAPAGCPLPPADPCRASPGRE